MKSNRIISGQETNSQKSEFESGQPFSGKLLQAEVIIRKSFKDFFRNMHRRIKEIGSISFAFNAKGIEVLCGSLSNTFWCQTSLKYIGYPLLDKQEMAITFPIAFEMDPEQFCKDMECIPENCYAYFFYRIEIEEVSLHFYGIDAGRFCIFNSQNTDQGDQILNQLYESKARRSTNSRAAPVDSQTMREESELEDENDDLHNKTDFQSHINLLALNDVDNDDFFLQNNVYESLKIQLRQISKNYINVASQAANLAPRPEIQPSPYISSLIEHSRQAMLSKPALAESTRPQTTHRVSGHEFLTSVNQSMVDITFYKMEHLMSVLESIAKMNTSQICVVFSEEIVFEAISSENTLYLQQSFTLFEQEKMKIVKHELLEIELLYSVAAFTMIRSICKTIPLKTNPKLQMSFHQNGFLNFCADSGPEYPTFELFFTPKQD